MFYYIFDGSFEGLLTCIYEAYYNKVKPEEIVPYWQFEATLLTEPIHITTDFEKSTKVYTAIKCKISREALNLIYHVFLSEIPGCCSLIYDYVKLGFKLGGEVNLHLHVDTVLNVHNINNKVTNECHRMLGFVRFKSIDDMFYSSIEPDHNILSLIAPHFASRLSNENWIIHDLKRNIAVFYNKKQWILTPFTEKNMEGLIIREDCELYESLWKEFYKTIAIADRTNPRYQKRNMPTRYWTHLTEFEK
jgi:probable DNA metabolism protein